MKKFLILSVIFSIIFCIIRIPRSPQGHHGHRKYLISLCPNVRNIRRTRKIRRKLRRLYRLLKRKQYDPLEIDYSLKSIELSVSEKEKKILSKLGNLEVIFKYHIKDIKKHKSNVPNGYKDLNEINTFLKRISTKYPKKTELINFAEKFGHGKTYEKRGIYGLKITENNNREDKLNVLVISCHHSREIITPEITVSLIKHLVKRKSKLKSVLKKYNVYLIPVLNVDGYNEVFTNNRWWRKNKKPPHGVDLNRNYDIGWDKCGGSTNTHSEVYRGKAPFSEFETTVIKNMIKKLNFVKVVDLHSHGRKVLYPITKCLKIPKMYRRLTKEYARDLAKYAKYVIRPPSADAEHEDYEFKTSTAYSFLIETGSKFQPSFRNAKREVKRVIPLLYRFLLHSIPLSGKITDSKNRPIGGANIVIEGIDWKNGETRVSDSRGLYHLFLPQGVHRITFTAPGYSKLTIPVRFTGNPIKKNIVLHK